MAIMVVYLVLVTLYVSNSMAAKREFKVDYVNDQFLKDGKPFRYVSGSMHYFRVPHAYWRDRMRKMRAAGLNAVCTYVEWSLHEPRPGVYDFTGDNDIQHYIRLAQEEGLLVILRVGPYICAERDLGGYPVWLLHKKPNIFLRTSDPTHLKYVHLWLSVFLPMMQPLLYGNGGPIIMVQVENEYGSYIVCDRSYTSWLRDIFRDYVGDKAVLFTTDGNGPGYLKCGPIPDVFTTVDFGPILNVTRAFEPLRQVQKHGPLVNSEFYAGHLTHWGDSGEGYVRTIEIVNTLEQLLKIDASFNFYMFNGGTNFAFTSGANNPPYKPQITSYDFSAPISESGNLTEKYYAIRSVISKYLPVTDIPKYSNTVSYGKVKMHPKVSLFGSDIGTVYGNFAYPLTFESLQLYQGFMLYETNLPRDFSGGILKAVNVHDRAIIYINKKQVGIISRMENETSIRITGRTGDSLGVFVENQGHINYKNMFDLKGLICNVTIDGEVLTNWRQTGYPLDNICCINALKSENNVVLPAFYTGHFQIQGSPCDTFVDMRGWNKGVLFVNGHNLGRYWLTEGPQMAHYLPGVYLRQDNTILVMEQETANPEMTLRLTEHPHNHYKHD